MLRSKLGRLTKPLLFSSALMAPMIVMLALPEALFSKSLNPKASKTQTPEAAVRKSHRLVMSINTDDPTTMRAVVSTALNLPRYYQTINEDVTIEIVAYNAGLHMFRLDTSPIKDLLKTLVTINPGVIRFVVCELTKAGMERSEGRPMSLIEGVDLMPSGPARVIELQEAGWSYLRN
jgi:intracellular sulfur oxidation DsrE/DsrF family protein